MPTAPQGTWRSLGDPEVGPWLDDVAASHPELGRDGVHGIWQYTTDAGYDAMNGALRSTDANDLRVQDMIDRTTNGLEQLPRYEGVTYRGTNLPDNVVQEMIDTGRYSDRAFSSSSLDPAVPEGFIRSDRSNPTFFTIDGQSGVNVAPFSAARGEAEILFRGGQEFEVLDNRLGDDGIRRVVLRERP